MSPSSGDANILLAVDELTKRYAVTVLDHVSFELRQGEIHALIGANGAGKSTLCRIIAGLTPPSSGSMTLGGHRFAPSCKADSEQAGVQIVQQELNLIPTLSVAENLFLNRLPNRFGRIAFQELQSQARVALDRMGLTDVATDTLASSLGVGQQQMVEIAAALARGGRVLILDEPSAALGAAETDRLFAQLRTLRAHGMGIIYISHRLDEISDLCDRVTVLRDGCRIATESLATMSAERMIALMTGEEESTAHDYVTRRTEHVALRVEGLTHRPVFENISFTVHRGERFGIAGLVGSGRTELLRTIFGADSANAGTLYLGGSSQRVRFSRPRQAVAAGLAMVTEDRKQNGLLLSQSIRLNTTLCSLKQFARWNILRPQQERAATSRLVRELDTRCQHIEQPVGELSGGNQQKVAIAKWLQRDADLFLFDEPTRGIDIAARRRIYRLFDALATRGKALIIVSSDTDELMETCDSIAVMSAGRLISVFERSSWSRESILRASFQGYLTTPEEHDADNREPLA